MYKKGESGNPATQFKKGKSGNPKGREKKMVNVIKDLPKDIQEKVYGVIAFALTLPDETTAKHYLESQSGELGKYGFLMQIVVKRLTSQYGWDAVMDIMDRLYGKPRLQAEVTHTGGIALNVSTDEETKNIIESGL